jgi:Tat protein translocase TatC
MNESKKPRVNPSRELTLIGHLDELRVRLIIGVTVLFLTTLVSMYFSRPVLGMLLAPLESGEPISKDGRILALSADSNGAVRASMIPADRVEDRSAAVVWYIPAQDGATTRTFTMARGGLSAQMVSPVDPFLMPLKVALVMGILLALPVCVWQIWLFVAPGLTDKEKRVVRPMLVGSIFLFPVGAAFAYAMFFFIMPAMSGWAIGGVQTNYNVRDYLKMMTTMMIVFGFIFELPLIVAMLARVGIVTPAFMRHYRGHIYVVLSIFAMLATPADPISMIAALVPLIVLFEISIYIAGVMKALRDREEAKLDEEIG